MLLICIVSVLCELHCPDTDTSPNIADYVLKSGVMRERERERERETERERQRRREIAQTRTFDHYNI